MALVIVRKNGQKVKIGDVLVEVWIEGRNRVKLVCEGPRGVQVTRAELAERAAVPSEDPD